MPNKKNKRIPFAEKYPEVILGAVLIVFFVFPAVVLVLHLGQVAGFYQLPEWMDGEGPDAKTR